MWRHLCDGPTMFTYDLLDDHALAANRKRSGRGAVLWRLGLRQEAPPDRSYLPGDLVFVYETQSGRTILRTYADGSTAKLARRRGREGIVALVEVTEDAYQPEDSEPEQYADGSKAWWRYCAPTKSINSASFVSRAGVNELPGYSEKNVFRGFGDKHSGLKKIPEDLFTRPLERFSTFTELDEKERIARAPMSGFGSGDEGPEHLGLKQRIADSSQSQTKQSAAN